tara:strand:- start:1690 stop:2436 length:747 start_codon:yes stop_codon:yes gene_type:complete
MKIVLDLWSGTGSATKPFEDAGYTIISVDINPLRSPTYCMDILDFEMFVSSGDFEEELEWRWKAKLSDIVFIWASPDCKLFSIANGQLRDHWGPGGWPKSRRLFIQLARVVATLDIIEAIDPNYWVLENPRGMLRTVPLMGLLPRRTVSYCQYEPDKAPEDRRMKPTDLWGYIPTSWKPKMCHNGASCHQRTPRSSVKGTEALSYDERIHVPYELGRSILEHCEKVEFKRMRWMDLSDFPASAPPKGG